MNVEKKKDSLPKVKKNNFLPNPQKGSQTFTLSILFCEQNPVRELLAKLVYLTKQVFPAGSSSSGFSSIKARTVMIVTSRENDTVFFSVLQDKNKKKKPFLFVSSHQARPLRALEGTESFRSKVAP